MTEEQKQSFQKEKAAIEKEISAMTSDQVMYDEHIIAGLYADLGAVNAALEDYDEVIQCYNEGLSYLEYSNEVFEVDHKNLDFFESLISCSNINNKNKIFLSYSCYYPYLNRDDKMITRKKFINQIITINMYNIMFFNIIYF
jgi:hypothetical protein